MFKNIRKLQKRLRLFSRYLRDRSKWVSAGGAIDKAHVILRDYEDTAGLAKGHYFHQDLLVASYIHEAAPQRHVDVGSRVDGFVAHVASFREIEVFDIRPLPPTEHPNIVFRQADFMNPGEQGVTDSLSCLHVIEHLGLGRYGDEIDVHGHERGIENLIHLLAPNGTFYISFPIADQDAVHFNAHRVFNPRTILDFTAVKEHLALQKFDYVDDAGALHRSAEIANVSGLRFGCGIYTFRKLA